MSFSVVKFPNIYSNNLFERLGAMGTHVSFIFRGYNPYIGGSKPSFFMVFGSKGVGYCMST